MQTTTDAYKAAVAGPLRFPVQSVLVDWDGDGSAVGDDLDDITKYVASVTVDRSLTTDLPDETTLVAGYMSAKATAVLTGDATVNAAQLWSPYSADSPFYGKTRTGADTSISMGFETENGAETVAIHTGQVSRIAVSGGASGRRTTLEALDGAERLRHRLDLPMVVGLDPPSNNFGGLNSQWVIDAILRSGGFDATPPVRPNTLLSATLLGSFGAEVGSLDFADYVPVAGGAFDFTSTSTCPYAQGPFGLAPAPSGVYTARYTLDPRPAAALGTSVVMAGWMFVSGATQLVPGNADVGWTVSVSTTSDSLAVGLVSSPVAGNADLHVDLFRPGATSLATVTLSAGWHYVGVQVVFTDATHVTTRVRVDGVTTTVGPTVVPSAATVPAWDDAQIDGQQSTSAVLFWQDGAAEPAWDNAFVPTAVLEPGLSDLTAIPTTTAADAFELLKEIVAAESGTFTFTGPGVATFWNRQHWQNANTTARTLTTTQSVLDLTTVEAAARTRNRIRVSTQPLSITPAGIIWQDSGSPHRVPPKGTLPLWADLGQDMAYEVDTSGTVIPSGGATVNGQSGYRAARKADGTGGEVSNLAMEIEPFVSTIKTTFTNPNSFEAWLVSPAGAGFPSSSDGQDAPTLVGRRVTRTPAQLDTSTVDPQTVADNIVEAVLPKLDPADERVYEAPSTPWRQNAADAQSMADDLLRALHRQMPQVQDVQIIADPSLELGDRVRLQDKDGLQLDEDFFIVGITTRMDSSGMTQSLTLRPLCAPGQWIWGREGRNIFGVTPW